MSNIKDTVMKRVHIVRMARPFVSTSVLSLVILFVALVGIGREVWVARVFENVPSWSDVTVLVTFFASAFVSTSFVVQSLVILAGAGTLLLARESAQMIRVLIERTYRRA